MITAFNDVEISCKEGSILLPVSLVVAKEVLDLNCSKGLLVWRLRKAF